jgi:hypothetical protein
MTEKQWKVANNATLMFSCLLDRCRGDDTLTMSIRRQDDFVLYSIWGLEYRMHKYSLRSVYSCAVPGLADHVWNFLKRKKMNG